MKSKGDKFTEKPLGSRHTSGLCKQYCIKKIKQYFVLICKWRFFFSKLPLSLVQNHLVFPGDINRGARTQGGYSQTSYEKFLKFS